MYNINKKCLKCVMYNVLVRSIFTKLNYKANLFCHDMAVRCCQPDSGQAHRNKFSTYPNSRNHSDSPRPNDSSPSSVSRSTGMALHRLDKFLKFFNWNISQKITKKLPVSELLAQHWWAAIQKLNVQTAPSGQDGWNAALPALSCKEHSRTSPNRSPITGLCPSGQPISCEWLSVYNFSRNPPPLSGSQHW